MRVSGSGIAGTGVAPSNVIMNTNYYQIGYRISSSFLFSLFILILLFIRDNLVIVFGLCFGEFSGYPGSYSLSSAFSLRYR